MVASLLGIVRTEIVPVADGLSLLQLAKGLVAYAYLQNVTLPQDSEAAHSAIVDVIRARNSPNAPPAHATPDLPTLHKCVHSGPRLSRLVLPVAVTVGDTCADAGAVEMGQSSFAVAVIVVSVVHGLVWCPQKRNPKCSTS